MFNLCIFHSTIDLFKYAHQEATYYVLQHNPLVGQFAAVTSCSFVMLLLESYCNVIAPIFLIRTQMIYVRNALQILV
jgi:hypothetical protein